MTPAWSVRSFPAGVEANVFEPGDIILTHRGPFVGALIRLGQRLRYRGALRCYAFWNHVAVITSVQGDLAEALVRTGVTRTHISKYAAIEYTLIRVHATPADQAEMMDYINHVVGEDYGFVQDLTGLLGLITFGWVSVGFSRSVNCSGLAACMLTRMGAYFKGMPETMLPADLAFCYGATKPWDVVHA